MFYVYITFSFLITFCYAAAIVFECVFLISNLWCVACQTAKKISQNCARPLHLRTAILNLFMTLAPGNLKVQEVFEGSNHHHLRPVNEEQITKQEKGRNQFNFSRFSHLWITLECSLSLDRLSMSKNVRHQIIKKQLIYG